MYLAQCYIRPALPYPVMTLLLSVEAIHTHLAHLIKFALTTLYLRDVLFERLLGLPDRFLREAIAHLHQGSCGVADLALVLRLPGRVESEGCPHRIHDVARHAHFGPVR